jgi:hypothetical protein
MATAIKRRFPEYAADPTQPLQTAVETGQRAVQAYLDGLDDLAALQRRWLHDTPLEPLADVTTRQAELARQLAQIWPAAGGRLAEEATEPAEAAERSATRIAQGHAKASEKVTELVTGPAEAPIAGYGELTAEQVIAKLPPLAQTTLAELAAYETAHESRATVLERIAALREPEPTDGYDRLGVGDVQQLLADPDTGVAMRVRDYERRHKNRAGVLQAFERQLGAQS